jgi:hypothetical protein
MPLQVFLRASDTMSVPGVNLHPESQFTGRERRRLSLARENGYLNAVCRDGRKLLAAYAQWCWRLRIPVVWSERCSPRSRYGRVRLDLFTTPNRLTADCQADMLSLSRRVTTSPHDARLDRVPLGELDRLATAVFRAATRPGNYRFHLGQADIVAACPPEANILPFEMPRAASG